jgi:hypothetical protein
MVEYAEKSVYLPGWASLTTILQFMCCIFLAWSLPGYSEQNLFFLPSAAALADRSIGGGLIHDPSH